MSGFWARALWWLPWVVIVADLSLIAAFAGRARDLAIVNNAIDIWFDRSDPTVHTLDQEHRLFGSESWMLATVWLHPDTVSEAAETVRALTAEIERIGGVTKVVSPTSIEILQRDNEGLFYSRVEPTSPWSDVRARLLQHPVAREFLVYSRSPAMFSLLVKERTELAGVGDERQRLVADLRRVLHGHPAVAQVALSGAAVLNAALNGLSWADFRLLAPATIAVASLALLVLLRFRVRTVLAILLPIGLTMLTLISVMLLAGRPLTLMTIALPGLIFTLGTATSLHVVGWIADWMRERGGAPLRVPVAVARHLTRPVLVSEVTTALGFGLLAVIQVTPVQEMALFGAAGILYSGLHVIVVLPRCLLWFGAAADLASHSPLFLGERTGLGKLDAFITWLAGLQRFRTRLMVATIAVCSVIAWLASMVVYDSTYLEMMDRSEPLRQDYARLASAGLPSAQLSVLIAREDQSGLMDPSLNAAIMRATADIRGLPVVSAVIGPAEIFEEVAPQLAGDEPLDRFSADAGSVSDAYAFALSGGNSEVGSYVHESLDAFRLVVLFPYLANSQLEELSGRITAILNRHFGGLAHVSAQLSGVTVLWANMDNAISSGQIASVLSMVAAMFVSFLVSVRDWRVAASATFVNVLPVASIGALLGAMGWPIDMATVFIMGVALGIADDDTSFTVHECLARAHEGGNGVAATVRHTGPATIATCTVIVLGFSALLLSSFVPMRTFGGLTALGLIVAMCCEVVVLPFLLLAIPATVKDQEDAKARVSRPGLVRGRDSAETP